MCWRSPAHSKLPLISYWLISISREARQELARQHVDLGWLRRERPQDHVVEASLGQVFQPRELVGERAGEVALAQVVPVAAVAHVPREVLLLHRFRVGALLERG